MKKKTMVTVIAVILCAAVLLGLIGTLTYRTLFSGESTESGSGEETAALTAEQLAAGIAEVDASLTEKVKDQKLTVTVGGEEQETLFTGELYRGAPSGTGFYRFAGPAGEWTFSGTLNNGTVYSGKVTNYPYAFEQNGESVSSVYTGAISAGRPVGDGEYEIMTEKSHIRLSGHFDRNSVFTGNVTDYPFTFGYNGEVFEGLYTGAMESGVPHGEGAFDSAGTQRYSYSGIWENGNAVGPGELDTDCAAFSAADGTELKAAYRGGIENGMFSGNGEMIIGDEKNGGYHYTGGWKDGAFFGEGTLICYDPSGYGYTYQGGFSGGAYSGYGELIFDDPNITDYIGNFENGGFRPDFLQLMTALTGSGSGGFELSPQVRDYLESHGDSFLSHDTEGLEFGNGFDYNRYVESGENPDDRCFTTHITILQKLDYAESVFGYPVTELIGTAGLRYYYGYYPGALPEDVEEGDTIEITAYPIGAVPLTDSAGNEVPMLRFAAFKAG